ncbi:hypothetical protein BU25DRAFT_331700 [Macroventuria anomochaeta]|uniref:Uncharacterized protein n=1 Tax=Macroventuria anomochaeta TaxID=301207 RepID=A0ACB6SGH3_9PLEO|nr:uncharacterized protein BU25DRAFT_331700 [Macroventuria anomochaeta]KAF2632364.1 hypothetical protein BU25DRAFT_331700 [Macroventuria anomochaeta]
MVNRILSNDPSKGDMHNRQASKALPIKAIGCHPADYHMWPLYLCGLSWLIPNNPMQAYLTLRLRAVGFETFHTNLLTFPAYTLFILQCWSGPGSASGRKNGSSMYNMSVQISSIIASNVNQAYHVVR